MNLRTILLLKSVYPVRIVALENFYHSYYQKDITAHKGEEVGIEAIDFSQGIIRCCNKSTNFIFDIFYDKESWEIEGCWKVKENNNYSLRNIRMIIEEGMSNIKK